MRHAASFLALMTLAGIVSMRLVTPAHAAAPPPPAAIEAETRADKEFAAENYTAAEQHYREALAAAPGRPHATFRLAKLLSWRDQLDESITLYRTGLGVEPGNMAARRELAAVCGWAERYDESLALYKELMAASPADRDLVIEYARTQAWSGDLAGAEKTLGALVAKQPRDARARVELARVYGWDNRLKEGERVYRSVIAQEQSNMPALTGLGENLSWQGRYDEALVYFDQALAIEPENKDALAGRARTYSWQGRHAEALAATREALALYPNQADIQTLARTIGGSQRPMLSLFATTTQDSDDNDMHTWGGRYTHYLGARFWIGGMYTHAQLGSFLPEEVIGKYDTVRVTGGANLPANVTLSGELGVDRTRVPVATVGGGFSDIEEHTYGAGLLSAQVDPAHWFTFIGTVASERFIGTVPTMQADVGIGSLTATAIFRPHSRVTVRATGQVADLTDDNGRQLAGLGVSWQLPLRRPDISVRGGGRWLSYDEDLNNGYFDPDKLIEYTAGFTISDVIGPHFFWSASLDRGIQSVEDFDSTGVMDYELLAGVNIGQSVSIEAYYGQSDSALSSPSGFKSTTGGVRARIRFGHEMGAAAPGRTGP